MLSYHFFGSTVSFHKFQIIIFGDALTIDHVTRFNIESVIRHREMKMWTSGETC